MQQEATALQMESTSDEPPPTTQQRRERGAQADSPAAEEKTGQPLTLKQRHSDWQWQLKNRIRSISQLGDRFPSLELSDGMRSATAKFPLAITPYYASLIGRLDASDPVFQMCIPQVLELDDPPYLKDDPLEEDEDMPVPGLVHRYPDRALLLATTTCSVYCRHCTRKRVAGQRETCITTSRLEQISAYLTEHSEIHDVIISGGDPFTMSTHALEQVLSTVRSVPSIDVIRIGTRTPVVLPMRIDAELVNMLKKYHPVYVNTHFNHPAEFTPEAREACERLADAGIPVGNQTVLLRGVNDHPQTLEHLFRSLVRSRVRPYYLFQCDLVRGVEHFRTPISKGIEIMEYLRGRLSGLAIPTFVVDAPHGGGKIPVLPNYLVSTSPSHTVLRNYEGVLVAYPEPGAHNHVRSSAAYQAHPSATPGVWDLSAGKQTKIQTRQTARHNRRQTRKLAAGANKAQALCQDLPS